MKQSSAPDNNSEFHLYPSPMQEIPKLVNTNNISLTIDSGIKVANEALDISKKVVNFVMDEADEFGKDIEKHRIENMIKLGKYERKYWLASEIRDEMNKKIKEEEKNFIFVKDKHLSQEEMDKLLYIEKDDPNTGKKIKMPSGFKIEEADQNEVIEELYPYQNTCCKCNFNMRDINIKGIENLKISYL